MTKKKTKEKDSTELEELNNKYLRALADYQNLEKRMHTAVENVRAQTKRDTLLRFIDILDDLEKAEVFVQDQGLAMVMERFKSILRDAGVEELDLIGKEFDPYLADAVAVENGEKDNIITDVLRKGYKLGDEVVRPAQVKVSKHT